MSEHLLFVTGRLAESSLRRMVQPLSVEHGFAYSIGVMPITVAALMTPDWISKRLQFSSDVTKIILPGYCQGDLTQLEQQAGVPLVVGPRDLRALPQFFGSRQNHDADYGQRSIEILAEINFAPRLSHHELLTMALRLAADGADVIDLGCEPGTLWTSIGGAVGRLREAGLRVSVDSFNPREIGPAVEAGAELVLSVNASNRDAAVDWDCEVVAIPDSPTDLASLDQTIDFLESKGIRYRLDPILEPIGFGFAASLQRYMQVRERYGTVDMMMGIGNLTELTEVDSAGINLLLMAICQELRIHSVLTTEVINWARSSVRECDMAGQLTHYAVHQKAIPKHVDGRLAMLRDSRIYPLGAAALEELATAVRDHNYRLFAEDGDLHLVSADLHLRASDPFELFDKLLATHPKNVDLSHAFYLGYELSKALTALTLGKQYQQDQSLDWGHLTVPEISHRSKRQANRDS